MRSTSTAERLSKLADNLAMALTDYTLCDEDDDQAVMDYFGRLMEAKAALATALIDVCGAERPHWRADVDRLPMLAVRVNDRLVLGVWTEAGGTMRAPYLDVVVVNLAAVPNLSRVDLTPVEGSGWLA